MDKISVILPCFNEEKIIGRTVNEVRNFSRKNPNFYFIFVDDGSTDNTPEIIENSSKSFSNISLVSYKKNKGKGYAIKEGLKYNKENLVCFIDSDLAYSLEYLKELLNLLNKSEMVIGSRKFHEKYNQQRTKKRRLFMGKSYNLIIRKFLGIPYLDTQAGIKGFRSEVAKKLFSKQKMNNFSFDVELIYLARKNKISILEMPVKVSEEHKMKTSQVKLIKDSLKMLLNIFEIKINDLRKKYG